MDEPTPSYLSTLKGISHGDLLDELDEELREVVASVKNSGKTGKVTLTLNIKPAAKGETRQLFVEPKIKTKKPRKDAPAAIFYADEEHQLHRKDPRQMEMDLRELPEDEGSKPLRRVDTH